MRAAILASVCGFPYGWVGSMLRHEVAAEFTALRPCSTKGMAFMENPIAILFLGESKVLSGKTIGVLQEQVHVMNVQADGLPTAGMHKANRPLSMQVR